MRGLDPYPRLCGLNDKVVMGGRRSGRVNHELLLQLSNTGANQKDLELPLPVDSDHFSSAVGQDWPHDVLLLQRKLYRRDHLLVNDEQMGHPNTSSGELEWFSE